LGWSPKLPLPYGGFYIGAVTITLTQIIMGLGGYRKNIKLISMEFSFLLIDLSWVASSIFGVEVGIEDIFPFLIQWYFHMVG
jgi:hypothetical protein